MLHAIVKRIQPALAEAFGKGTVPAAYRATWRSFLIPWMLFPLLVRPIFVFGLSIIENVFSPAWQYEHPTFFFAADVFQILIWGIFLGFHAKEHLAQSHVVIVPRFRETYASVLRVLLILIPSLPACSAFWMGDSFWGTLTLLASLLAVVSWMSYLSYWLLIILVFVPFLFIPQAKPLAEATKQLLEGDTVVAALPVLAVAAFILYRWTVRLTTLNEQCFEYHARIPATEEANKKLQEQYPGDAMLSIAKRLSSVRGYVGDDPRQRIRHWQLGQRVSPPWMCLLNCVFFFPMVIGPAVTGKLDEPASSTMIIVMAILAIPFLRAFHAINLRNDMSYESLRPHSKRQFIREWGLAIWSDTAASALTMIAMCVLVSIIFWRDIFSMQGLVLLSLAIGGLALAAGATSLVTAYHRDAGLLIGVLVMLIIAIGAAVGLAMKPEFAEPALLWIGIGLAMVLTGIGLMRLALWAWCDKELGT